MSGERNHLSKGTRNNLHFRLGRDLLIRKGIAIASRSLS